MQEILPAIDLVDLPLEQRKEVLHYIVSNSTYAKSLNLRHLVVGLELYAYSLKDKELDWKATLSKLMRIDPKLKEIAELLSSNKSIKQQIKDFSGSRTSYYKVKKMLK